MGEKVYRPILKDGDHLANSTSNPDRKRGVSFDDNNKNPDIPEWEELDLDELYDENNYYQPRYEMERTELPPEAQAAAEAIGEAVAAGIIYAVENYAVPWIRNTAWPGIKRAFSKKKGPKKYTTKAEEILAEKNTKIFTVDFADDQQLPGVSDKIDRAFETFNFEMSVEEAQEHMMKMIYHMLGLANEIRILSNSTIKSKCESDEEYIERRAAFERYLTENMARNIDALLADDRLTLGVDTSRELFSLFNGGVNMNGEYVPVQLNKVHKAICSVRAENEDGEE